MSNPGIIKELCGACGLCCNGAIFGDVQLQAGDNKVRLGLLGLEMKCSSGTRAMSKFLQPCAAHDGCRCRIYSERPSYCREFECALLKNVCSRSISKNEALRIIRDAKAKLATINELLAKLENTDETLSHRARFKQVTQQMKDRKSDQAKTIAFGELTLAVHELNVLIAASFYPGHRE
jgi:uncharacterized protein